MNKTVDPHRLEALALALAGELHAFVVTGELSDNASEVAFREIGGLETLATLLNKSGTLTETGASFAKALIEETRDWLAEMGDTEGE